MHLCENVCFDVYEARNTGSRSEPINCVVIGTVTLGFTVPETVVTKIYFCGNMCLVE